MNRILAVALLAAGLILLVWGMNASHSFASGLSKAFTGHPTDKALWMMIGGAVLAVIGAGSLMTHRS